MNIVFTSSEVVPFSKTGGLADVSSALPAALARRGHEVTIMTPRYGSIDVGGFDLRRRRTRLAIAIKGKTVQGGLLEGTTPDGVPVLFVDQPGYFERDGLYGMEGEDYDDNDERFTFFCRAVLEACRQVGISPDIIHCNDWQTGPVSILLQSDFRDRPELNGTGTVFTIHNLAYQGLFAPDTMMTLGLPWDLFTPSTLEFYGKVSFMKAGLVFSDRLTTVSRKYAREIQTPAFGFGLDKLLQERGKEIRGILNGVDYRTWDPRHDPLIAANYTAEDTSGKAACKADLQQRMHLPVRRDVPLIGCISRLTHQKGLDLFLEGAGQLLEMDGQWAFLGTGDPALERALQELASSHPDRVAAHIGYSDELAHRIEAGADIFLMPSRFEPCGLNQIYSLRYGTVPIVRAVGGLDDTIDDVEEADEDANGFKFSGEGADDLVTTVRRALGLYGREDVWRRLMHNGMVQDYSWDFPARRYEAVYRDVIAMRKPRSRDPH